MARRFRAPEAKAGELLVMYGREDSGDLDVVYTWPENICHMSRDSKLVMRAFEGTDVCDGKSLRKELEARGYDITTLKFSIKKNNPEETK